MIEYLAQLGPGAAVAAVMFVVYRETVKQMREDRILMEERIAQIIDRYDDALQQSTCANTGHTKVLAELLTWLQKENGHKPTA